MLQTKISSFSIPLFLILSFFACNGGKELQNNEQAILKGSIRNIPEGKQIELFRVNAAGPVKVDSTKPDGEGNFEMVLKKDEERIYLFTIGEQRVPIFLEPGNHDVNGDFNQLSKTFSFSNSPLNQMLKRVNELKDGFDREAGDLQMAYQKKVIAKELQAADSIENLFFLKLGQNKTKVKALIDSIGPNPVSHIATSMLSVEEDFGYLDTLAMRFTKEKPKAYFTQKLNAYLEGHRKFAVGQIAPDFVQLDPNGKQVKLSSFQGKWLLLDFWASWCKPCRAENPNLVAVYNKFKTKGFTIFSVSLDSDKSAWMKAMITDRMMWAHASDLKGWQNEAAQAYNINSIPMSLLLDPNGKIVAKNLRGEALNRKLTEVLH